MSTKINCGVLIDGTGQKPQTNCSITIDDGKIKQIEPGFFSHQENGEIIDWSHCFVVPGLFDCHDHITEDVPKQYPDEDSCKVFSSFIGTRNCLNMLKSGVTTLRDAGAMYGINIKLREAIKKGIIEGPDMIASGNRICRTGWPKWFVGKEADGIEGLRKAVRQEQKDGADLIKLTITGVGAGNPLQAEYSEEEVSAGIKEAHRLGLAVGAHANGGPITSFAIQCGLDIVDHGSFLSDDDFKEMSQRNTFLVITISATSHLKNIDKLSPLSDNQISEKDKKPYLELVDLIQRANQYGVTFSLGSDHFRSVVTTMRLLSDSGFSPEESVAVMTRNAAKICGVEKIKGTIEIGKNADFAAFSGNPENPGDYKNVAGVMKSGILKSLK